MTTPANVSASQATNDETSVRPDILAPVPEETQETTAFAEEDIVTSHERMPPSWGALWAAASSQPNQGLATVLERSYQIANIAWTPGAHFTNLLDIDLAKVLSTIPQIADKLKYYKYFRFKSIRVKVRIQATGWHYGALALSHVPANSQGVHRVNPVQALHNDPMLISAASADDVDYTMPWAIPLLWGDVTNEGVVDETNIIRFYIDSIIPLSMLGTTVKNAEIVVFANFEEPEVAYPRTYVPPPQATSPVLSSFALRVDGHSKNHKESDEKSTKASYHASSNDFTAAVLDVANFVKEVAPIAMEIGAMLDKPTTTAATTIMQHYVARDMVYGEGLDNALKLSLYPSASVTTDGSHNGGDEGNPKLLALMMTPGYFMHDSWTDTAVAGTKVADFTLKPHWPKGVPAGVHYPTFLEWFSHPFAFWRGSLRFSFYCFTSTFITSRVRFVHFPPGVLVPATLAPEATGDFFSRVYDVTGDTLINFTVPWLRKEMWLTENYSLGSIAIYITNLMTSIDSALPPTVHLLGFMSAAEDFQVGWYGDGNAIGRVVKVNPPAMSVDGQSKIHVVDNTDIAPLFVDGQSSVWIRAAEDDFESFTETATFSRTNYIAQPEEYGDLITCMKRYNLSATQDSGTNNGLFELWQPLVDNQSSMDIIQYLTACHCFSRGSRRYKLFPLTNGVTPNYVTQVDYRRVPQDVSMSDSVAIWKFAENGYTNNSLAEIEVPFFSGIPYECINGFNYEVYQSFRTSFVAFITRAQGVRTVYAVQVWTAVGDDFQVGYLCSPPATNIPPPEAISVATSK
jgi:hypothetical protein